MVIRSKGGFLLINAVMVALLSLISCTSNSSTIDSQSTTLEPQATLTNTPFPQPTLTVTSLPTSRIPLPTFTLAPLPTGITVPTLPPENAYRELEELLRNGCKLPCLAGIIPGETLAPFMSIADFNFLSEKGGSISLLYPKDEVAIYLSIYFLALRDDEIVRLQKISTRALKEIGESSHQQVYDAEVYHKLLGAYSMQNILAVYGRPSEIYMTVEMNEYEPGAPDFVVWWLMYPEKGIIAKYTGNAELTEDKVDGCPSKTFVDLWLFSPYDDDRYEAELLSLDKDFLGYVLPAPILRTKPIDEALGMSIDEFYRMFSKPNDECLETLYDIWPKW